jgi:predicted O-methyltransferase YrrM
MDEKTLKSLIDKTLAYAEKPLDPFLDTCYNRAPAGYTYDYYRLAYFLAQAMQPEIIVELGTQYAQCTAHFAGGAPQARVVTVDYLQDITEHPLFRRDALERYPNIEVLWADSADRDTAARFEDGSIGICFSDALHKTEHVLKEVAVWTPKMHEGSVWLFDDFLLMPDLLEQLPFKVKGIAPGLHKEPAAITGRPDLLFGYAIV